MPDIPKLLYDGYQHQLRGQLDDAARIYRKILRAEPGNADVLILLGMVRDRQLRHEEAIEHYDKAIRLKPELPQAHFNRGNALYALGRLEAAAEAFCEAYRLKPDLSIAFSRLAELRRYLCDWRDFDAVERDILSALRGSHIIVQPPIAAHFTDDPALLHAGARTAVGAMNFPQAVAPSSNMQRTSSSGLIRLGYLSADFRAHAVGFLIAGLIERHDRSGFEVTAISLGENDRSSSRLRFERSFDRFFDMAGQPTEDIVGRIRDLGIDILVDLTGHFGGNRLDVLAAHAAPIQVNYLGYPGTIGGDFVDYILVDPFIVPIEQAPFYSEKLVHLPDCYQPNDPQRFNIAGEPTRAECGLPEDSFVFCCFNNGTKITPQIFDIWTRLLARVPRSVLWLLKDGEQPAVERNLLREAAARNMDPGRLVFAPYSPPAKHLARQHLADLFLDTFPYGAHTTASDALWAGLPIVTYAGRSFQARVAGSLLNAVGLSDLVTGSLEEYETLAFALASEPARLAEVKGRLAHNRLTTPVFDIDRYRRHIEAAYDEMISIYRRNEPPRTFKVKPILAPA